MKTVLLALMFASAPAFAATDAQEYARLVKLAKISISDAMATGATKGNGAVVKVELDSHRGQAVYDVEVLSSDERLYEIRIDAVNGNVLRMREDRE